MDGGLTTASSTDFWSWKTHVHIGCGAVCLTQRNAMRNNVRTRAASHARRRVVTSHRTHNIDAACRYKRIGVVCVSVCPCVYVGRTSAPCKTGKPIRDRLVRSLTALRCTLSPSGEYYISIYATAAMWYLISITVATFFIKLCVNVFILPDND